jgi:prepilin-type N-terminal cleavage/methylation domain-containing protein/prepilin-type processing-associated H-X9-DG protein
MPSVAPRRHAFTLVEILVAIAIIGILIGLLIPAIEKARHNTYIATCASNLQQIGQQLVMYASTNHGDFPRTRYAEDDTAIRFGTGGAATDPFASDGPQANDVTAAVFLLMRVQKLPPKLFICAYNDVNVFEPDRADVARRSNFTDYRKNLGYSFANPYPSAAATRAGYRWSTHVRPDFAIAADINPGRDGTDDDVTAPTPGAPQAVQEKGLSRNHEKEGQNVLYGDGHVQWQTSCLSGAKQDNIYMNRQAQILASPVDADDSVLLPVN